MSPRSRRTKQPEIAAVWRRLFGVAAWLAATLGSFLTFPVKLSLSSSMESAVVGFGQFLVASIAGLTFGFAARRKEDSGSVFWVRVSAGCLVVALVSFLGFIALQGMWTCDYATRFSLVIGSELSDDSKAYVSSNPGQSCSELIADYAGNTERIYRKTELTVRFVSLALLYMVAWAATAGVVVSIGHSLGVVWPHKR
jgi:hypothetical protein